MGDTTDERLAPVLAGLSLATDTANAFSREKALRTCVLAVRLARAADLDAALLPAVYYGALVRFLGCTGFAHEEAHRYGSGDDVQVRSTMAYVDGGQPLDAVRRIVSGVGKGTGARGRPRAVAAIMSDRSAVASHAKAQCDAGRHLGALIGMPDEVLHVLDQAFERWDGNGVPVGLAGEDLHLVTRVIQVADVAELFSHGRSVESALHEVRARAGGQLDPKLAATFLAEGPALLAGLLAGSVWDEVLDIEPGSPARLTPGGFDRAADAFARYADLKSVWTLGHSTGLAQLVETAARGAGWSGESVDRMRRSALLHDIGRVAIPNSVWDKPGPLNQAERALAERHAYETHRVLISTPVLAELAEVAAHAHERCDGTGYHRGLPAPLLGEEARLLAAAESYHSRTEARPHRPALSADAAAQAVAEEAGTGTLDLIAVRLVLDAAGAVASAPSPSWPAGLSDREVEVVRLVAAGATNKDVARALGISAKTVAHHVSHVYDKVGVRSRAGLALFAIDEGLTGPDRRLQ